MLSLKWLTSFLPFLAVMASEPAPVSPADASISEPVVTASCEPFPECEIELLQLQGNE